MYYLPTTQYVPIYYESELKRPNQNYAITATETVTIQTWYVVFRNPFRTFCDLYTVFIFPFAVANSSSVLICCFNIELRLSA